jgi:ATP-binding cassette subfamily B protein
MKDVWNVLYRIFRYYPVNYSFITLIRIFGYAGLGLLSGLAIKRFFDYAAASALTPGIVYEIAALLIVIPLIQALTYSIDLALSYGWTEIIRSYFRRNLFRYVLEKPGAAPLPVSHGKLTNILRSDVAVPESLMWDIPYFLAYAIFSLGGLVMLAAIDWTATAAFFSPLLLAIAAMRWLKRRIAFHYDRQQLTSDRFLGMLSDMFRHYEAIRVNNAADAFMERLGAVGEERAEAGKRNAVFHTILASVYDNIVNAGTALLLLTIGTKMRTGDFSIGSFTLFLYFLGYVSGTIRLLGTTAAGFRKTDSALARIRELVGDDHVQRLTAGDSLYLKEELPACGEVPIRQEILERIDVCGFTCTYAETGYGIRDLSFSMPRASFTVVTGPVGSGKTTLLRAVLGLLPACSGELVWNGRAVDSPARFFVPPVAGYVPQVPALFGGTLRDNVLLGYPDDGRLDAALQVSVLEDDVRRLPAGADTLLGPNGAALSGGQRQRVAVARMAARQAQLWVLDDSSSALDAETEIRMWERIDALRRSAGITCLVVSTKPFVLQYADQVIALRNGRIDPASSRLLA